VDFRPGLLYFVDGKSPQASRAAKKVRVVILSEAKYLSVLWTWSEERFFASLRMTPKIGFFRGL
jgi:hypothetical protein